ncbi:Methyltransferase-like protein 2-A [Eumeta japonica]|uniref:Methyltransferase-like protein 2-A n=1 Tax=Eumeta variegata TaxID=151549 RepID=A0A4C1TUI3_EUMVA|nr:Methyltransferase-like protein 2-A [Eumeta japonica]
MCENSDASNLDNTTSLEACAVATRPMFGNRFLTNEDDVFTHNAWDNVEWDRQQENNALEAVAKILQLKCLKQKNINLKVKLTSFGTSFYGVHQNKFSKTVTGCLLISRTCTEEGKNKNKEIYLGWVVVW